MSKLRKSARGQVCTLRIVGVCNRDPNTTVLAHTPGLRNSGAGMGRKAHDAYAVYACSACHDMLDRRVPVSPEFEEHRFYYIASALAETHQRMMEAA